MSIRMLQGAQACQRCSSSSTAPISVGSLGAGSPVGKLGLGSCRMSDVDCVRPADMGGRLLLACCADCPAAACSARKLAITCFCCRCRVATASCQPQRSPQQCFPQGHIRVDAADLDISSHAACG